MRAISVTQSIDKKDKRLVNTHIALFHVKYNRDKNEFRWHAYLLLYSTKSVRYPTNWPGTISGRMNSREKMSGYRYIDTTTWSNINAQAVLLSKEHNVPFIAGLYERKNAMFDISDLDMLALFTYAYPVRYGNEKA